MKVLFLTRYPVSGASSRYRVFQYVPHLEAMGVSCRVQSFMDEAMYRLSMSPGRTGSKIWATLCATLRRLAVLARAGRYDIIYMQRELFPFGPPVIERLLKARGKLVLFDYDDALFIKKASRYNPIATFLRSPEKTREIFRIADCTVAGNDWLRDAARAEGGQAETIEVAEDAARYFPPAAPEPGKDAVIGWLGSPSTSKYLQALQPVLSGLAARRPDLRFEIMGGGDFAMDGVPWQGEPWSLEGERAALARWDIGLMPLPQEDWAKGKSGGKARTYMAAGVVPVAQAIGYNLELIRDGETGFLCSDAASWKAALTGLLEDPDRRLAIARAARAEVEERFDPRGQAAKMKALFETLQDARG